MDIMSWKRHILDKPTGTIMEQTAGVGSLRRDISTVDLDLMGFISAHLWVMKLFDAALQPTLAVVPLQSYVVSYKSSIMLVMER